MIEIDINKKNLIKFVENLRTEDQKELEYFYGKNYKNIFIKTVLDIKNTRHIYFLADENLNPVAIGGAYECDKNKAQLWLLSSKKSYEYKVFLFKYYKNKIDIFKKEYDVLFNFVFKTNFKILNWLKRHNFKVKNIDNKKEFKMFIFEKIKGAKI